MLTAEEKTLLGDYKKAFKSYYRSKRVIDLDKNLHRKLDIFLVRLAEMLPELGKVIPPYKHSKFTILYVSAGSGERKIGNIALDIRERTLMVIPAYTVTSASYGHDIEGYYLTFNVQFFLQQCFPRHHLVKMNLFAPQLMLHAYIDPEREKLLTAIFEMILDELSHNRKSKEELIALKILELIILCERMLKIENDHQKQILPPLVSKYMQLIIEQYKMHHNTNYYAQKLHVHPNQLNANTKRYLGQPAKATIDSMLLRESEQLLHQTTLSVKELAYELGFQSASSFSRFFKRHKGISPAAYRNQAFENVAN